MNGSPPRVLLTIGDPNGIGPEIAVKASWQHRNIPHSIRSWWAIDMSSNRSPTRAA